MINRGKANEPQAYDPARHDPPPVFNVHHAALQEIDKVVGNELTLDEDDTTRLRGILHAALNRSGPGGHEREIGRRKLPANAWYVPEGAGWCPRCGDVNYEADTRICITCTWGDSGYADGRFASGWPGPRAEATDGQ